MRSRTTSWLVGAAVFFSILAPSSLTPPGVLATDHEADLSLSKNGPFEAVTGELITYQLHVFNFGPANATNVVVTDTLPAGTSFDSATSEDASCSHADGVVTCDIPALAAFDSAPIDINVTAPLETGTITNVATATADESDPSPASAEWATEVVEPHADLILSVFPTPDPVAAGHQLTYDITVDNLGPLDATGVTLTDDLPDEVSFVSVEPAACQINEGIVSCDLGTIEAHGFAHVEIVVTAPTATGTITNHATVEANEPDLDTSSNIVESAVEVVAPQADLSVSGFAHPDPVVTGEPVTYSLSVFNEGPLEEPAATLTATIPAGATFVDAEPSQGSCSHDAGLVTCSFGSILAFEAAGVEVIVLAPSEPGAINSTVAASGTEDDLDPADNTADIAAEVVPPNADLSLFQVDEPDPVEISGQVTYQLSVFNNGPLDATNVTVEDTIPAGSAFISATPSQGSCAEAGGVVTCSLGGLVVFGSAEVSVVVQAPGTAGTMTNSATVSSDQADLSPEDNTSEEPTEVVAPVADLRLTMVDTPDPVALGGEVTYTIQVWNDGPLDAHGVTVTDTLPSAATFVSAMPDSACSVDGGTIVCDLGTVAALGMAEVVIVVTAPSTETDLVNVASVSADSPPDPDSSNNDATATTRVREPSCITSTLPPNDDGSTELVPIGFDINFFGTTYSNLYVNNNGNVTFTQPLSQFTPSSIVDTGLPIIAPFWGDVDTRGTGSAPVTYGPTTVDDRPAFCVEWSGVGYFSAHDDKLNDFQLLLVDRSDIASGDFDMVFTYRQIEWEAGDASGGTGGLGGSSARAGYSNGDTSTPGTSLELPGSAINGGFLDTNPDTGLIHNSRNSDTLGVYVFPVRNGEPPEPTADVSVTQFDSPDPVDSGQQLTYFITVSNAGPDTATGVTLTDTLPEGVTFESATATVGTCSEALGVVTCELGDMIPGTSAQVEVVVTTPLVEVATQITNVASVEAVEADPQPDNDSSSDDTTVDGPNQPPVAIDDTATTNETRPVTIDVLANDEDPNLDSLVITGVTTPGHGSIDCSTGTCVYTPEIGFVGTDSFEYTVSDGEFTDTATVTIDIAACPVLAPAIDGSGIVTGQAWIACSSHDAHAAAAFQPDGMASDGAVGLMTSGTVSGVDTPGTSLSQANGLSLRGANDVSILRLDLDVPMGMSCLSFDLVFGSEEYPEFVGSYNDAFLAELDLSDWSVSGNEISAPNNFAFDHTGGVVSVNSAFFDPATVVIDNGTGYDGSTGVLEVRTPITPGPHAIFLSIFDANDEILDSGAFIGGLTALAVPADECEAGANQPPSAADDAFSVVEDSSNNALDVLANDSDPDTDPVSLVSVVTAPEHGTAEIDVDAQQILYTPNADYNGPDTFTYRITDGRGASSTATVDVAVLPVNDVPTGADGTATVVQDESVAIDVGSLVADVETAVGDLTYEIVFDPENGTLSGSGPSFTYTPTSGYVGDDAFSYRVIDRGDPDGCTGELSACDGPETSGTHVVAITVLPRTHVLTVILEGDGAGSVTSDPAGITCPDDCSEDYVEGTSVTLSADPEPGSVFVGWSGDCTGIEACVVTIAAARNVTATFALNTPPSVDAGGPYSGDEGQTVSLDATVSDPDAGDTLTSTWTYSVDLADAGASCAFADAGVLDTSVTCTDDGSYTLTLTVDDGVNEPVIDTAELTLANVDPSVLISAPADGADYDIGELVSVSADIADAGTNDTHTCSIDWGDDTVTDGTLEAGVCTASHAYAADGAFTITVSASDDDDGTGSDSVAITVTAAPTFPLTVTLAGDGAGSVTSDPAGIDCPEDCSEDYDDGTLVTLAATPEPGSLFSGWSGDCSGESCTVTMDQARSVTATFDLEPTPTADLRVTQVDIPDPVTAGNLINYLVTVTNDGPDDATGVTLTSVLSGGASPHSADEPCTIAGSTVICALGTIPAEGSVSVSIVATAPITSTNTIVTNTATVDGAEDDPDTSNNMAAEQTVVEPAPEDPDVASGWITADGGMITTGAGKGPSHGDPMTTSVTVPPGYEGLVSIVEGPITNCPTGYRCFGQEANILAPTTTAEDPMRFVFSFHPSTLPPATQLGDIVMFHDDVLVERCADTSGDANPDPCIESVARVRGVIQVVVLTSENGSWRGGRS